MILNTLIARILDKIFVNNINTHIFVSRAASISHRGNAVPVKRSNASPDLAK